MKTTVYRMLFASCCAATGARAQTLPAGNYTINATVIALSGSACPLPMKLPASGVLYYPGPGHDTTQLVLEAASLGKSLTTAFLFAFPPVPPNGLNGWSSTNPASPNYTQFQNATLTGGGTAAIISFNLGQISQQTPLSFALGTMTINVDSIAPCKETLQLILQKVAPFKEAPG